MKLLYKINNCIVLNVYFVLGSDLGCLNYNLKSSQQSLDVTLSSDDLENFGILKGTKTHHNNFFNPPKISESNDELDNFEFQHSSGGSRRGDGMRQ